MEYELFEYLDGTVGIFVLEGISAVTFFHLDVSKVEHFDLESRRHPYGDSTGYSMI